MSKYLKLFDYSPVPNYKVGQYLRRSNCSMVPKGGTVKAIRVLKDVHVEYLLTTKYGLAFWESEELLEPLTKH